MKILTNNNRVVDTDVHRSLDMHYSVLSFKDYKNPDFYFERASNGYEQIECSSATIQVGDYILAVPFPWCILVTDYETVDCPPIESLLGKSMPGFCLNPIDGYRVEFPKVKLKMVYPSGSFIVPVMGNKDMLVAPLGYKREKMNKDGVLVETGPLCVVLSPSKMELSKPISDIW